MYFYTALRLGTGTHLDPYRPDLPARTNFVGEVGDVDYLITTPANLAGVLGATLLDDLTLRLECEVRGLAYKDVTRWRVGKNR